MVKTLSILIGCLAVFLCAHSMAFAQEKTQSVSDGEIIRTIERMENELRELKSQVQKRSGYYRPTTLAQLGVTVAIVPLKGINDPFDDKPYRLGLRIEKIDAQLEADRMHLAVGDTIVKLEETRVESEKHLDEAMKRAIKEKSRFPAMLIVRNNQIRLARLGEP